jgi:hypothetical protein
MTDHRIGLTNHQLARGDGRAVAADHRRADRALLSVASIAISRIVFGGGRSAEMLPTHLVHSDANGAWQSPVLPPDTYVVTAATVGFLPRTRTVALAAGEHVRGIDVELAPGGTLVRGMISERPGGAPIAGARVTATSGLAEDPGKVLAISRDDGRYELTLASGGFSLAVSHPDFADDDRILFVEDKPLVADFQLVPGGVIEGVVIARDTGQPVADVNVETLGHAGLAGNGISGADGRFRIRGLTVGSFKLVAAGPGYASRQEIAVELGIAEQVAGVRVLVDRAFKISGRVVDKVDHHGLAGATVRLDSFRDIAATPATSDGSGAFTLDGLVPGTKTLYGLADGHMPVKLQPIVLKDRDLDGVVMELERGVTVSGRIEPAGQAWLHLEREMPPYRPGYLISIPDKATTTVHGEANEGGTFVLHAVPAGKLRVVARARDGGSGSVPIVVNGSDVTGLVIHVDAKGTITGHVVDTSHAPVADALVEVTPSGSPLPLAQAVDRTGPGGEFRLAGLDPGKYDLGAQRGEWHASPVRQTSIELADHQHVDGISLVVPASDKTIRGSVLDSSGNPVADAWVTTSDSNPVLTGSDGRFVVDHLADGTYTLVAQTSHPPARASLADVEAGDTVVLSLEQFATLTGHVTIGGVPMVAFELECRSSERWAASSFASAVGAYAFDHLPPGPYACIASGDAGVASGEVDVPASGAHLELAATAWATVTGEVVDDKTGRPVPDIGISAGPDGPFAWWKSKMLMTDQLATAADGRFVASHVLPGPGVLKLWSLANGLTRLGEYPYAAGAGQRVDLGTLRITPPPPIDAIPEP